MKNNLKKATIMFVAFTFFVLNIAPNLYASSVSMYSSSSSLDIGKTTTITINGSDATGRFNISSNSGAISLSSGSVWVENNAVTVSATANAAGTATITLTPIDVASSSTGDAVTSTIGSKSISIRVNAPAQPTTAAPTTNTNTTTTNTTTTSNSSSNAKLKKLVPNYEGLSPNFNPDVTKYSLTVPATATNLGLTVAVEASGAKYWINGEENLKMGDNTVTVTVTSTNGTKKVYTIIVTKVADVAKANAYLSNIVIDGKTLSPAFTAETLEYDIGTVTSDVTKLTTFAYAQDENAKVEITGNDALVDGENTIKIKVTAVDGTTIKEYTIKVTKEAKAAVEAVAVYDETNSLSTTPSGLGKFLYAVWMYLKTFWLVLSLFAFCIFEFIQIVIMYRRLYVSKSKDNVDIIEDEDTLNSEAETNFGSRRRSLELEKSNNDFSWRADSKKEELTDKDENIAQDNKDIEENNK